MVVGLIIDGNHDRLLETLRFAQDHGYSIQYVGKAMGAQDPKVVWFYPESKSAEVWYANEIPVKNKYYKQPGDVLCSSLEELIVEIIKAMLCGSN